MKNAFRKDRSLKKIIFLIPILMTQVLSPVGGIGKVLFPGADPDMILAGKHYWIFPTNEKDGNKLFAYSSKDLKTWLKHGKDLLPSSISVSM